MTRAANARLTGFVFLIYISTALGGMVQFGRAANGVGTAAKLASIAYHAPNMRHAIVLTLLTVFGALVLAIASYTLTRDYDPELAVLALSCRVIEGIINAFAVIAMLELLRLATGPAPTPGMDAAIANAVATLLLKARGLSQVVAVTVFAVGSTLYSYLFLRARTVPVVLAWVGVLGSIVLATVFPAQLAGVIKGPLNPIAWVPLLILEAMFGLWLLIKGVGTEAAA